MEKKVTAPHRELQNKIKACINAVCSDYVAIGYYLKQVNDRKLYLDGNYSGIGDYAAAEYGIAKDRCSWLIRISEKFCEPDSPELLPEYQDFNISKLREMIYLTEEQLEQVTDDTTVKKIREIRKSEKKPSTSQLEEEVEPDHNLMEPHDESWFVKQYFDRFNEDLTELVQIYHRTKSLGHMAKDFQKYKAPYDGHCHSCSEYDFTFHGFAGGMDFRIGKEEMHLKYGRLVSEALNLYNTLFEESISTSQLEEEVEPEVVDIEERFELDGDDKGQEIVRTPCDYEHSGCVRNRCPQCAINEHCCADCEERCNAYCGWVEINEWALPVENEPVVELELEEMVESAYQELDESEPVEQEFDEYDFAKSILKKHQNLLNEMLALDEAEKASIQQVIERQKLEVAAFSTYILELEKLEIEEESMPEQPELPVMKNNDQRKEFLESYETWPIWIDQKETEERYYRYDLPDGNSIVVKVYFHDLEWRKEEQWGNREIYLIRPSKHFKNSETNMTSVIEHLKGMQKKKEAGK